MFLMASKGKYGMHKKWRDLLFAYVLLQNYVRTALELPWKNINRSQIAKNMEWRRNFSAAAIHLNSKGDEIARMTVNKQCHQRMPLGVNTCDVVEPGKSLDLSGRIAAATGVDVRTATSRQHCPRGFMGWPIGSRFVITWYCAPIDDCSDIRNLRGTCRLEVKFVRLSSTHK